VDNTEQALTEPIPFCSKFHTRKVRVQESVMKVQLHLTISLAKQLIKSLLGIGFINIHSERQCRPGRRRQTQAENNSSLSGACNVLY
jgi:hypothetical protein